MNKKTAIVFFGIIILGLAVSLVSLNTCGKRKEMIGPDTVEQKAKAEVEKEIVVERKSAEPAESTTDEPAKPIEEKPVPEAAATTIPESYPSPAAAMQSLASKIQNKDAAGFMAVAGEDAIAPEITDRVRELVAGDSVVLDEEKPITEISKSAKSVRWSLNFAAADDAEAPSLYADLDEVDGKKYKIGKISLPLTAVAVDTPALAPSADDASIDPVTTAKPTAPVVPPGTDPLTIAHAFSKAIVGRDFVTARALSDPDLVTDERVAALMIAVEEGKFDLKSDRPLVVTLSREDITWVLTRISSPENSSEFALELGQRDDAWAVNGLTFSKVLSALAEQGGGGDVAYSPIVEDPEGGDSLVMFFEFDNDKLSPRASRQLAIVADILSQGVERTIRINGHADALGSDDYNAALSDGRAESIRKALISMGVAPSQVVTEGFGASKPRLPNFLPDGSDNPTGRSGNRRAEVYLDF